MKKIYFALSLLLTFTSLFAQLIDLQTLAQNFVLETKRIELTDYPYAFNASILRWRDFVLMSFRTIPDPKSAYSSWMGVVLLDNEFNPIGQPQILETRDKNSIVPPRAEDGRLIYIGEKLHIIYSDNPDEKISAPGFRMVVAELAYENGIFSIKNPCRLVEFEGSRFNLREKNWVPFEYQNRLLLAYSISPHLILEPLADTGVCMTKACSSPYIVWDWGILRGGTPAVRLDTGEYLSFFHSMKKMATLNSKEKNISHYFVGAYTFSPKPPFKINRFSAEPIVGPGFYTGTSYIPYWGLIQCVFPTGLIVDDDYIWFSYGRQDHEIWVAKLDKKRLLKSLVDVH